VPSSPVPWEGLTATSLRVPTQQRGRPMEVGVTVGAVNLTVAAPMDLHTNPGVLT
jgi:hypothetical protein